MPDTSPAPPRDTLTTARRRSRPQAAATPEAVAARARLTPESWIDAATEVLVDRGIDHVRVDVLAAQLGATRGSFYCDREDLLRHVLKAWQERVTVGLTQRLETAHRNSSREQLRAAARRARQAFVEALMTAPLESPAADGPG